ncbi:MAG TPA: PIN domain-containing protein [Thermoanaerobaculia bacterium]
MKFWDSSAVVPLLVSESSSDEISHILSDDRQMHVWWATEVECTSTLARLEREGVDPAVIETALSRLAMLREDWSEIAPVSTVRDTAKRLLRLHPLRAADALQLAAAFVLADSDPGSVSFVSLDDRLRHAARLEGFVLLPR